MNAPSEQLDVRLEPLRANDVRACARIERELFEGDDPWSERAFAAELAGGHYYLGAYTVDEQLVGYAGLAMAGRKPHHEAEIHTIGVTLAYQGRGIGRRLLRALLERADSGGYPVYLEVRTDNETAIGLYEANGFHKLGIRRHYYHPSGADAYTMERHPHGAETAP